MVAEEADIQFLTTSQADYLIKMKKYEHSAGRCVGKHLKAYEEKYYTNLKRKPNYTFKWYDKSDTYWDIPECYK